MLSGTATRAAGADEADRDYMVEEGLFCRLIGGEWQPLGPCERADGVYYNPESGEVYEDESVPKGAEDLTEEQVESVLRRISRADADAAARAKELEAATRRLEAERRRAEKRGEFYRARYGPLLERYLRAKLAGTDRRSLNLPSGTLALRRSPPRLTLRDEDQARAWLEEHSPAAIRMTISGNAEVLKPLMRHVNGGFTYETKVPLAALQEAWRALGEPDNPVPPGCVQVDAFDTFAVKTT